MKKKVIEEDYYICTDSECNTAYFSLSKMTVFDNDDISTPIWYKANAKTRYACYCNKVTIEEVKEAIQVHGCKTIKDLMKVTKVMINGQCKINHPYGQCICRLN